MRLAWIAVAAVLAAGCSRAPQAQRTGAPEAQEPVDRRVAERTLPASPQSTFRPAMSATVSPYQEWVPGPSVPPAPYSGVVGLARASGSGLEYWPLDERVSSSPAALRLVTPDQLAATLKQKDRAIIVGPPERGQVRIARVWGLSTGTLAFRALDEATPVAILEWKDELKSEFLFVAVAVRSFEVYPASRITVSATEAKSPFPESVTINDFRRDGGLSFKVTVTSPYFLSRTRPPVARTADGNRVAVADWKVEDRSGVLIIEPRHADKIVRVDVPVGSTTEAVLGPFHMESSSAPPDWPDAEGLAMLRRRAAS